MPTDENGDIVLLMNRFSGERKTINTEPLAELFRFTGCNDGKELAELLTQIKNDLPLCYGSKKFVKLNTVQEHIIMLECIARIVSRFKLADVPRE